MLFEKHEIHPKTIILVTDKSFIFLSNQPFTKHHLLISPIEVKPRLKDLTRKELLDLSKCIRIAVSVLKKFYKNCSIGLQDGSCAGQSVRHLHFHVLPVKKGQFDCDRKVLSFEEMKCLAEGLQPFFNEEINKEC